MKKGQIAVLVIGIAAFVFGGVGATAGILVVGVDNLRLDETLEAGSKTYEGSDFASVKKISIDNVFGDVTIVPSTSGNIRIDYFFSEQSDYTFEIKEGELRINDTSTYWGNLQAMAEQFWTWPKKAKDVTITVDIDKAFSLDVGITNGSLNMLTAFNDLSTKSVDVNITNGTANISNQSVASIGVEVTNGRENDAVIFKNCNATSAKAEVTNGKVIFEEENTFVDFLFDAANGQIITRAGALVNCKEFDVDMVNGDVDLKLNTETDGKYLFDITNGKVTLNLSGTKEDYRVKFSALNGHLIGDVLGKDNVSGTRDVGIHILNGNGKVSFF